VPLLSIHAHGNMVMWGAGPVCTLSDGSQAADRLAEIDTWLQEMWASPEIALLGENFEVYDHSERKVISELH
jgi:hypothetical protein